MVIDILVNVKCLCFFVCNVVEILFIYWDVVEDYFLVMEIVLKEYDVELCVDECVKGIL